MAEHIDPMRPPKNWVRITPRISKPYHDYLQMLSYQTDLDISQIIRLLIHLAPYSDDFQRIIEQHSKKGRKGVIWVNDWRNDPEMWLRL